MAAKKQTSSRAKSSSKKNTAAKKSGTAKKAQSTKRSADKATDTNIKKGVSAQTKAILMLAASVLLFFLIFVQGENVWYFFHSLLMGLFGNFAVLWPILLLYIAIVTAMERKTNGKILGKLILSIAAIMLFSGCIYVFTATMLPQKGFFEELAAQYVLGTKGIGAGLFGGILGIPAAILCGLSGAEIILVLILIVVLMFLFGITLRDIYKMFKKPVNAVRENVAVAREQQAKKRELRRMQREQRLKEKARNDEVTGIVDKSIFDDDDTELMEKPAKIDIPLEERGEAKGKDYKARLESIIKQVNTPAPYEGKDIPDASKVAQIITNKKKAPAKSSADQLAGAAAENSEREAPEKERESRNINNVNIENNDQNGYSYPPVELLHPSVKNDDSDAMNELQENGEKLIETLKSFGVNAKIINICRGPSVTRFEIQPAPGVKISKITNLADDIALNLAANGVRMEAPIPGKAAVGIEVPNKIVSMVSMRELIDSRKFRNSKSKLSVVLGKDISGNIVVTDLGKMPHLLIAGTTGSGKSVCVNSILLSLLYKSTPEEVKLLLIDPKMVEFSKYKGIPHLLIPVVSDAKKAAGALNWAVSEMLQRYKTFAAYNVRDIESYNKMIDSYNGMRAVRSEEELEKEPLVNEDNLPIPTEKMSRIVIAIDELADLMMAAPNEVEESICRLAQMARAAGMHLVIATQRPSVNVITGVIKANIPSRISLKVSSQVDSRTILDIGGAEKLIGRGDMLFAPVGVPKPLRVQGCYASDEEIENVTGYIKKSHKSDYNEEVAQEIEKIASQDIGKSSSDSSSGGESDDPMMEEAIKLVVEAGQASTSLLQRRLRLGYARAGRLIDEMEQMGIVGPHEGSKSRQVLMSYQQWLERNNLTRE